MGILLVYDVSDSDSFENVRNWMRQIDQHASESVNKVLIGNKCDVEPSARQVTREQGEELAKSFGIKFFETSAKDGTSVDDAFVTIASDVQKRLAAGGGGVGNENTLALDATEKKKQGAGGGCCK